MCETKAGVVSLPIILLAAANFFIYQAHTEKEMGRPCEIKSQSPYEF